MDLTFKFEGVEQVQNRFRAFDPAIRGAVERGIQKVAERAASIAQSKAPAGGNYRHSRTRAYGHGNIPKGIWVYYSGGSGLKGSWGGGVSRVAKKRIDALRRNDPDSYVGLVISQWFTGRFFEAGVNTTGVTKRREFKRKIRATIRRMSKKTGLPTSDQALRSEAARTLRARIGQTQRRFFTPRRPFMAPAFDAVAPTFADEIRGEVIRALGST